MMYAKFKHSTELNDINIKTTIDLSQSFLQSPKCLKGLCMISYMNLINSEEIISKHQFGFRSLHPTITALLN